MAVTTKDLGRLTHRMLVRWTALIVNDAQSKSFWDAVRDEIGDRDFSEAERLVVRKWVKACSERLHRILTP